MDMKTEVRRRARTWQVRQWGRADVPGKGNQMCENTWEGAEAVTEEVREGSGTEGQWHRVWRVRQAGLLGHVNAFGFSPKKSGSH